MKAIKALVIFMGILIVAGLGLLGYGMYTKAGRSVKPSPVETSAAPALPSVVSVENTAFETVVLRQPPGTRIAAAEVSGGLLVLRLTDGGQPDRVSVIDVGRGSLLGNIILEPTVEAPMGQ